jgi:hypothetical protein
MTPQILHDVGENRSVFHEPPGALPQFSSIVTVVHREPTDTSGSEHLTTALHPVHSGPDRPQLHSPYYYCFSFLE